MCRLPPRSNVPGDSIDEDIHHESTGQRKVMKYLKENVANSLAALMRK